MQPSQPARCASKRARSLGREGAVEVVGDELDELAARERVSRRRRRRQAHQRVRLHSGSSAHDRARARCRSTRWLPSVRSSSSHTSSAGRPARSRSVITARWPSGSALDRVEQLLAQLAARAAGLGVGVEAAWGRGPASSAPKRRGIDGRALARRSSVENGTVRASRTARVRARLTRMLKIHVRRRSGPRRRRVRGPRRATSPGRPPPRRPRAHEGPRDEPQRAVVACDERREGGLVPGSQTSEQLGLVGSQGATLPQAAGAMLWLRRKKLSGSYLALIRASRAQVAPERGVDARRPAPRRRGR